MSKSNTERIPFEPNNRSKRAKEVKKPSSAPVSDEKNSVNTSPNPKKAPSGIPDEVNSRLIRRAAIFCGVPTGLGLTTFIISYILVSKHIFNLPTSAVVLFSMLFLGIGVLGLSYGAISASWDEGRVGSWWGGEEFKKNFGHLSEAWKSQQQLVKATQKSKDQ